MITYVFSQLEKSLVDLINEPYVNCVATRQGDRRFGVCIAKKSMTITNTMYEASPRTYKEETKDVLNMNVARKMEGTNIQTDIYFFPLLVNNAAYICIMF